MRRLQVWIKRAAIAATTLAVLLFGGVYAASEMVLRRTYDVPMPGTTAMPTTAEQLVEGERKARILGCYGGCHGTASEGRLFFSEPGVADLVAPNLTRIAAEYTDAELERAIRHGVRRDGTGLFAMPSPGFYHLSGEDVRSLLAFLRHQPRVEGYTATTSIGPLGRLGIVTGQFKPAPALMDHGVPRLPAASPADPASRGRYLARIACAECHGDALQGGLDGRAPSLAIAAAYTEDAFRTLLRTGEPLGKRNLDLMDDVARGRFAYFTDDEIAALHAYLRTLASR